MADDHKDGCWADHKDITALGPKVCGGDSDMRLYARHRKDHVLEVGICDPERMPKDTEVVDRYKPKAEASGPAKVATPAFRAGWDRIFGGQHTVGQA